MKNSILIRPAAVYQSKSFEARLAAASAQCKDPATFEALEDNNLPVVSVNFDAAKNNQDFYSYSHESTESAVEFYKRHPQLGAAIFELSTITA
jgi:hypothetical protein